MFWRKDNAEKKLNRINDALKKSFANVKKDTGNIFQWLNYFYRKSMEQEQMLRQLQMELSYTPKTREEIRRIIDEYYSFEPIMGKIKELNERVNELSRRQSVQTERAPVPAAKESFADVSHIEKRLERLEQKKFSIKEKIIRRITRNSKEYVKSVMLSYIRKYERISALHLKEIVVDEQNFCSKSSFYRLLEEIEGTDEVGVIRHGKEKHYLAKAIKQKPI
ncbi:hypothetical protein HYV80_03825 [Candidatus Woesearchaeota archaeon]|nr:hypothetical protein [Candidatus Woesearchaeota archaeon]